MAFMGRWAGTESGSLNEGCEKMWWLPPVLRTSMPNCLASVSSFGMDQSFGFWRIAVSNLAAVFMFIMIAPAISLCKRPDRVKKSETRE